MVEFVSLRNQLFLETFGDHVYVAPSEDGTFIVGGGAIRDDTPVVFIGTFDDLHQAKLSAETAAVKHGITKVQLVEEIVDMPTYDDFFDN